MAADGGALTESLFSQQQAYVWRGLTHNPSVASGNVVLGARFPCRVDPARFEAGMRRLADRHDALRAAYRRGPAGVELTVVDVSERKRALAAQMGFRAMTPELWAAQGVAADVAFHASATSAGLQTALAGVGFESAVVELSWFGTREVTVSLGASFHARRQQIVCSQVSRIAPRQRARWDYGRRKELVFRLLEDPRFDACITHEAAFVALPKTYDELDALSREGTYCVVYYG